MLLHDPDKMKEHEDPFWEIEDPEEERDCDGKPGRHIVELINFSKADWTSQANHGLRQDFESKSLLLPYYDDISTILAEAEDETIEVSDEERVIRRFDNLEGLYDEVEELKSELTTIVMSQTGVIAREHWDVPEIKLPNGKKGRLRKDRYSALLIANMIARQRRLADAPIEYDPVGGFAASKAKTPFEEDGGPDYSGPDWFVSQMENVY